MPFLDHELVELAGRIPPELKLADGGKGVLKRASRGIVPDEVIDRTKGYFPVPAIRQLEGPYLDRVRDALTDPAARDRGLFRTRPRSTGMLADPNTTRTTLGSNALWQLALLEMWLQDQDASGEHAGSDRRRRPSRAALAGDWSAPGAAGDRPCPRTRERVAFISDRDGVPEI